MTDPFLIAWSKDISGAPRGFETSVERIVKGKTIHVRDRVYERCLLATKCGKVVQSYWLPEAERWSGLATKEQPIAWAPWPLHPFPFDIDGVGHD